MMKTTQEQQNIIEAVQQGNTHIIINAVAGAGKTSTLIEALKTVSAHDNVLFCAFNVSIRKEIDQRVCAFNQGNIDVKNIHQLGLELVQNYSTDRLKINAKKYSHLFNQWMVTDGKLLWEAFILATKKVLKEETKELYKVFQKIILDTVDKVRLNLVKKDFNKFLKLNEHYGCLDKNKFEHQFEELLPLIFNCTYQLIELGTNEYYENNSIDFVDMLYLPMILDCKSLHQYDRIFIDECQDLSKAQLGIVLKFTTQATKIVAVGDPYQSIYGFTGADSSAFDNFKKILTPHIELPLTASFRCPEVITDLAKEIRSDITSVHSKKGSVEIISKDELIEKAKAGDMIICRWKEPLIEMVYRLVANHKKITIDMEEINEIVYQLTALFTAFELENKLSDELLSTSFSNEIVKRNVKRTRLQLPEHLSYEGKSAALEKMEEVLESKMNFIRFLYVKYQHLNINLNQLCAHSKELFKDTKEAIRLSTIHKAKGLEADNVYLLKYEEMPLKYTNQKDWEYIQEQNLKYVGITRAKQSLYIVAEEQEKKVVKHSFSSGKDNFFFY